MHINRWLRNHQRAIGRIQCANTAHTHSVGVSETYRFNFNSLKNKNKNAPTSRVQWNGKRDHLLVFGVRTCGAVFDLYSSRYHYALDSHCKSVLVAGKLRWNSKQMKCIISFAMRSRAHQLLKLRSMTAEC